MSILAAQIQLRRRWLFMVMRRSSAQSLVTDFRNTPAPRCFATITQKLMADTHHLSNEEIKQKGIQDAKRPPGTSAAEFWHQRRRLTKEFFTSKEVVPVYPLLFMVSMAFILGIVTMYRELAEHPTIVVNKTKRREHPVPELDEEADVEFVKKIQEYYGSSPLRRMVLGEHVPAWIKLISGKLSHQPERLPGDDKQEIVSGKP